METLKTIIQYNAIISFVILAVIGVIQKDWNIGFGMNLALVLLYVFIYLQPIK